MSPIPLAFLNVEIRDLPELEAVHKYLLYTRKASYSFPEVFRRNRQAFDELKELVSSFGLDSDTLLHIGVLELDGDWLLSYDCCIEFPLPIELAERKTLPGGHFAVLTVDKTPEKIGQAIRQFRGDYIPEHELIVDEERPIYEIYYKDTLEYCVPLVV